MVVNILKFFTPEELDKFEEGSDVNVLKSRECPACGSSGVKKDSSDTEFPFVLFLDTGYAYCFISKNTFNPLELVALKNGMMDCHTKEELESPNG